MEVKKIIRKITVKAYLISFGYETRKGYYKDQQRLIKGLDKEDVANILYDWAREQRTMSNVQILGIEELENTIEEIEI